MTPDKSGPTPPAQPRRSYFTPRWFADLLSARLSLGDTFWAGGFGTALIFVPLGFIIFFLAFSLLPAAQYRWVNGGWIALLALFYVVLTTAVFRTARRTPEVGAWRWVGVLVILANAVGLTLFAMTILSGPPGL